MRGVVVLRADDDLWSLPPDLPLCFLLLCLPLPVVGAAPLLLARLLAESTPSVAGGWSLAGGMMWFFRGRGGTTGLVAFDLLGDASVEAFAPMVKICFCWVEDLEMVVSLAAVLSVTQDFSFVLHMLTEKTLFFLR